MIYMPKFQLQKQEEDMYFFTVITDSGYSEDVCYKCLGDETPEMLMSRVAHHMNDEIIARDKVVSEEVNPNPVMEALPPVNKG